MNCFKFRKGKSIKIKPDLSYKRIVDNRLNCFNLKERTDISFKEFIKGITYESVSDLLLNEVPPGELNGWYNYLKFYLM